MDACIATANLDNYRGIGLYKELGYIPYNVTDHYNAENWSLSKTLEYAFDDYCIAEMAKKMGKQDITDEFYKRSQNYKNVYNPATSFMQPRDDKGIFIKDFKADDYTPHICESNGWQYFWSVQHDINGLIDLVGGKNRFAEKLDSMFTYHPAADDELPIFSTGMIGQYAHGNEPSHHVIYLFNAIGHEKSHTRICGQSDERALQERTSRSLWQRRLRTDVSMVCIQCDGILPRQSRQWKIRDRYSPIPGNAITSGEWKDFHRTGPQSEQRKYLYPIHQNRWKTV